MSAASTSTDSPKQPDQPDADPLDLLCHLAFNAPLARAENAPSACAPSSKDFFEQYGPEARQILDALLDKYTDYGAAQFEIPQILEVPPINEHGNVMEIAGLFGGADGLREAVAGLQAELYVT